MKRLVVLAALVGAGACSFTSDLKDYCGTSQKCACDGASCCVLPGNACEPGVAECCGGSCASGRCEPGGDPDGGEPDAGLPDAGEPDAGAPDAGTAAYARGVLIPSRELPDGGFDSQSGCSAGQLRAGRWDGMVLDGALCCTPDYATGECSGVSAFRCVLPGFWSGGVLECCLRDANTAATAAFCPLPTASRIDVSRGASADELRDAGAPTACAPGDYAVLSNCCTPNGPTCEFPGARYCSLAEDPGTNPCCFVLGPGVDGGERVWSDCRVTGSCVCTTAGGCMSADGARCVVPAP